MFMKDGGQCDEPDENDHFTAVALRYTEHFTMLQSIDLVLMGHN